ncbi:MAG: TetR/AcrR family transcriptional regulator [Anaerolineaceae bacterium]
MARIKKSRDKIMETATQLFGQNGYDATSVQEICSTAGVSKGAFYHYFSTKENLFLTLLDEWVVQVREQLVSVEKEGRDVPGNLIDMAGSLTPQFNVVSTGFPILIEFWRQAGLNPEVWQKAIAPYYSYMTFFENQIEKGVSEGSLDSSLTPTSGAHLIVAFSIGYFLQASMDPGPKDWTALISDGMRMLLDGIRSKK